MEQPTEKVGWPSSCHRVKRDKGGSGCGVGSTQGNQQNGLFPLVWVVSCWFPFESNLNKQTTPFSFGFPLQATKKATNSKKHMPMSLTRLPLARSSGH